MPRPESELTKSGRAVGIRLTEWEYQEWMKIGGTKWLRAVLKESKQKKKGIFKAHENKGLIGNIKPYSVSYISNNMPYIIKLNNGHSQKRRKINWIGDIIKSASKTFS